MAEIQHDLEKLHPRFQFFHSRSGLEDSTDDDDDAGPIIDGAIDLDQVMFKDSNPNPEPKAVRDAIGTNDDLLYIYTSGTTGLPKAVIIKHIR